MCVCVCINILFNINMEVFILNHDSFKCYSTKFLAHRCFTDSHLINYLNNVTENFHTTTHRRVRRKGHQIC